jgi:hypothetical protein
LGAGGVSPHPPLFHKLACKVKRMVGKETPRKDEIIYWLIKKWVCLKMWYRHLQRDEGNGTEKFITNINKHMFICKYSL